jgi:purine nucleoside phosphorylase
VRIANIAALKHLGVKAIVAFSAVGSLKEEVRPGDIVITLEGGIEWLRPWRARNASVTLPVGVSSEAMVMGEPIIGT